MYKKLFTCLVSSDLATEEWKVEFAPPPKDIYWKNLSGNTASYFFVSFHYPKCLQCTILVQFCEAGVVCSVKREWYISKWVASNLFLFLVAFFLTTPAEVVSQIDKILIAFLGPSASTKVCLQSLLCCT